MTRPTEFEDLVTTSVTIGRAQLHEAKDRNVNISEVLRSALSRKLRVRAEDVPEEADDPAFKGVPVALKQKVVKKVSIHPKSAAAWAEVLNRECGTRVTAQDIISAIPRC